MDSNLGVNIYSKSTYQYNKITLNKNKNKEKETENKGEQIENENEMNKDNKKNIHNQELFISLDEFYKGRKFIGIKFPGKIENKENALRSIGGIQEIKKNVQILK